VSHSDTATVAATTTPMAKPNITSRRRIEVWRTVGA
jgi:hypothetical protein